MHLAECVHKQEPMNMALCQGRSSKAIAMAVMVCSFLRDGKCVQAMKKKGKREKLERVGRVHPIMPSESNLTHLRFLAE